MTETLDVAEPHTVTIDGIEYLPASTETGTSTPRIGVGITTRNRHDILKQSLEQWRKHLPAGAMLVVVDDASNTPVPQADYRFTENVGIARAKNKALELLHAAGCDHIFLADDDVWPTETGWHQRYIDSPEPHLMWIFDKPKGATKAQVEVLYRDDQHVAYHATRGCLLYVERRVLEAVGGMDPNFGKWGWEHVSWSDRIHSAGWTTWRYADITNSKGLFHSLDAEAAIESTATEADRRYSEGPGQELRMRSRHDPSYIEFRDLDNVILTCLLTAQPDPQRKKAMDADPALLATLAKSTKGHRFVVLHTDLPDGAFTEQVKVSQHINPYFERWLQYFHWLRDHPEVGWVWCVDGTDVEMLRTPFADMEPGTLYVGSEPSTLRNAWMLKNHPDRKINTFMQDHPDLQLLNAGLVGGDRETVMAFCQSMCKEWFDDHIEFIFGWETERLGIGDMGAFQWVTRNRFSDKLSYGPHVNTVFKANETNNTTAWFKHK